MAKTVPLQIIRAVMTKHGGPPFSLQQDEAAGQTFAIGALVRFVAGLMTETTTDVPVYGVGHGQDVFPPNVRDTGTGDSVWVAEPGTLFAANLVDSLNEGVAVNHVLAQGDLGIPCGFVFDTINQRVYLATGAAPTTLIGFIHRPCGGADGEVGDTNARVLFTFLPQALQDMAAADLS